MKIKLLTTLALGALSLVSCIKTDSLRFNDMPIKVEVADMQHIPDGIKSSYTDQEVNRINNLNILVYHNGALLERCCRYFDHLQNLSINFPGDKDGFNIYMLGNVGNIISQAPESEAKIEEFQMVLSSYKDLSTKGFPIANSFKNFKKNSPTLFKLKRLVGQYNISIRTKATDAEYTIKQVRFKNCALDFYPFKSEQKAIKASIFADNTIDNPGDHISVEDLKNLNAGLPVNLYFMENLQGTLLPHNTDPKKKTPQNLPDPKVADHCTYLEIVADVKTPAGLYTDAKYRYYLGADATTNFDIHRSRKYILSVSMAQDMVSEDGWRIEVEPPVVIGEFKTNKTVARVIQGAEDAIFIEPISGNHAQLKYTVEYASQGIVDGRLEYSTLSPSDISFIVRETNVASNKKGVYIESNKPIIGPNPLGSSQSPCGKVILAIKSVDKYNGNPVMTKYIRVDVYNKAWPIVFKKNQSDNKLYVYIDNPLKLPFMIGVRHPERYFQGQLVNEKDHFIMLSSGTLYMDANNSKNYYAINDRSKVISGNPNSSYTISNTTHKRMEYDMKFVTPDWNKFNLIDERSNQKDIEIFIGKYSPSAYINYNETNVSLRCADGQTRNINMTLFDEDFPRWSGMKYPVELEMQRTEQHELGPRRHQFIQQVPNAPDEAVFALSPAGHSGDYTVTSDGQCQGVASSTRNISELEMHLYNSGISSRYPFKHCNNNKSKAATYPFYIANGIGTMYKLHYNMTEPASSGDVTRTGFYAELYGPGRDLETTPASYHYAEYFMKNQKQLFGRIHRWFDTKGYYYSGTFMTINGYTCWPYGSTARDGVQVPSSIR